MTRRAIAIVVLVAAVVAFGVADRQRTTDDPVAIVPGGGTVDLTRAMPTSAPSEALGSTWYCGGGTASGDDGLAEMTVFVFNPHDADVDGSVTVYGSGDVAPVRDAFTVGARSRFEVAVSSIVEAEFAAALVEVDRGGVAVDRSVSGERGADTGPCASSPSDTWTFPAGSTTRDVRYVMTLFNPFPGDAVADVTFATDEGVRAPQPYADLVIPGKGLTVLEVSDVVTRRSQFSASVVLSAGRVVADRLLVYDGSGEADQSADGLAGARGITSTLGAPSPAISWSFPEGPAGDGVTERYVVYNPSDATAEVDLVVDVDDPEAGEVAPFELSIPGRTYGQVLVSAAERMSAEPLHSATVQSLNEVPVVAERVLTASDPAPRTGVSYMLGAPVVATRWLAAAGAATSQADTWIVVHNPSPDRIARVSVRAHQAGEVIDPAELTDIEIQPTGRVTLRLRRSRLRGRLAVVIEATAPVVVERDVYGVERRGFGAGLAVADGDTVEPAPAPVVE